MPVEPGLLLWLWIFVAPLALMLFAMHHERRTERARYRPPAPQPGDDWGGDDWRGGTARRPGWWHREPGG